MKARVKSSCRWKKLTACNGVEFVSWEYRAVPIGREAEVESHPWLEAESKPKAKPKPKPKPRATKK